MEQKVSGQTYFWKSNSLSSIPFFFKVLHTKTNFFSHCQENLTLVILEEKMRVENGDGNTDEWGLARDREGDIEREEGWTSGSRWWNARLIWNEFEELVQVKVTIYITVPDYSSHLLLNYHIFSLEKRTEEMPRWERNRFTIMRRKLRRGAKGEGRAILQAIFHECCTHGETKPKYTLRKIKCYCELRTGKEFLGFRDMLMDH